MQVRFNYGYYFGSTIHSFSGGDTTNGYIRKFIMDSTSGDIEYGNYQTCADYIDINGDGLPDRVVKLKGSKKIL